MNEARAPVPSRVAIAKFTAIVTLFLAGTAFVFSADPRVALPFMASVSLLIVWLLVPSLSSVFTALVDASRDLWPLGLLVLPVVSAMWPSTIRAIFSESHGQEAAVTWATCLLWPLFGLVVAGHRRVRLGTPRGLSERSDGVVIGIRRSRKKGNVQLLLSDDVSPTAAPRAAEFAAKIGLELVRWEPFAHRAFAEKLEPLKSELRQAAALMLDIQPWELDLAVTADEEGRVSAFTVSRAPAILDRSKRRALWLELVHSVIVPVPNTTWRFDDHTAEGTVTLHREMDLLRDVTLLSAFSDEFRAEPNPAEEAWKSFPVALTEDGRPVEYGTFQTLIVGQTGSGKGSAIWSIISGLIPSAREGFVKFVAIDPKNSEAKAAAGLFEEIAIDPGGWSLLLERLVALLKSRQGRGRKPALTVKDPLILLFIDELSALTMLDTDSRRRTEVMQNLLLLLSQGRSDNILVLAAVQAPMKEFVGQARMFFGMRIAMRTEVSAETDLVLGDGASASGATAHLIPVANEGNGYMSAGTAYMRMEGEATPIRVRFPFTDDDQLAAWSAEFSELRAARQREWSASALAPEDVDPTVCSLASDASAGEIPDSLVSR